MSTFCPLPWNSVSTRNNGDMRICCHANSYTKNRGILRKEDGSAYNAGVDDWSEVRNSDLLKEVRTTMLKGEWHSECERCKKEEENGFKSRRIYEGEDWGVNFGELTEESIKPYTEEDGTIDVESLPINYMDIRYGNFCNLKCRMCGPTDSHAWYDDWVKLNNRTEWKETTGTVYLTKNKKGRYHTDAYNWFVGNEHHIKSLYENAKNLKKLYIVGGEPLIIQEHSDLLDMLVKSGHSKNLQLEYNTNLTNITDKVYSAWENFGSIRIGASIDGYGKVLEYQRYPANWDAIYENMQELENNKNINLKAWIAFTITVYNVYHLPEFMKWKLCDSNLTRFNPATAHRPVISEHLAHLPRYLNIKMLPKHHKEAIVAKNLSYCDWIVTTDFSDHIKNHFQKILKSTNSFIMSEDLFQHQEEFIETTVKLDKMRKQNVLDVVPEFKDMFDAYYK
jgi:hypothetical protein